LESFDGWETLYTAVRVDALREVIRYSEQNGVYRADESITRIPAAPDRRRFTFSVAHPFNVRQWLRWRIRDKDPLLGEGFVRVALCRHVKI
jgi:hypothetical protein